MPDMHCLFSKQPTPQGEECEGVARDNSRGCSPGKQGSLLLITTGQMLQREVLRLPGPHQASVKHPKQEHETGWRHPGGRLLNATERPRQARQAKHAFAIQGVEV